jgi:hypothetical protein
MAKIRDKLGYSCFEAGDEVGDADLKDLRLAPRVESHKGLLSDAATAG